VGFRFSSIPIWGPGFETGRRRHYLPSWPRFLMATADKKQTSGKNVKEGETNIFGSLVGDQKGGGARGT